MSGCCWGSDLQHREPPRELLTRHLAPFPLPHHSICLLVLAAAWEPDTGLDPARNAGRVWTERSKGPALTSGCKSGSCHTLLSSNTPDTLTQGVPSSPATAWQRLSSSRAASSLWNQLRCPRSSLCFPTQRHVLPTESSSARVTASSSSACFAARVPPET